MLFLPRTFLPSPLGVLDCLRPAGHVTRTMAFLPPPVLPARHARPAAGGTPTCGTPPPRPPAAPKDKKRGGFLGTLRDAVLRPLVAVPGSQASGARVVGCPFCTNGRCDCTGCGGSKVDPLGGGCIMCGAVGSLTCTVCNGVGAVDRVRRGGTDGRNQWTKKRED